MSSSKVESGQRRHRRTSSAPVHQYHDSCSYGSRSTSARKAGFITPEQIDHPEFGIWTCENRSDGGLEHLSSSSSSSSSGRLKRKFQSATSLPGLMDSDTFSSESYTEASTSRESSPSFSSFSSSSIPTNDDPEVSCTATDVIGQNGPCTLDAPPARQQANVDLGTHAHASMRSTWTKDDGHISNPFSAEALSLIPIRQAVSISFYLFLSIVTALSLLAILFASYGLTLADDVKVRVGKAVEQATDLKKWASVSAREGSEASYRYKRHSSSGTSTPSSGYSSPSSGTRTPEAREVNDEKPSRSLLYTVLSLASLALIPFILRLFRRRSKASDRSDRNRHKSTSSSSNLPPRPPLKTLIPSIILALMVALLGFTTSSSSTVFPSNSSKAPKHEQPSASRRTRKPRP